MWSRKSDEDPSDGPFGPKCNARRATQDMLPSNLNAKVFEVITFHCPPREDVPPGAPMIPVGGFLMAENS
jgi:hypothetical protein